MDIIPTEVKFNKADYQALKDKIADMEKELENNVIRNKSLTLFMDKLLKMVYCNNFNIPKYTSDYDIHVKIDSMADKIELKIALK